MCIYMKGSYVFVVFHLVILLLGIQSQKNLEMQPKSSVQNLHMAVLIIIVKIWKCLTVVKLFCFDTSTYWNAMQPLKVVT